MNIIEVKDVCFSRDEQEVLHNVSFSVALHSFVVLVGPNGGGKTTLLKLLLGELEPTYGRISVLGMLPRNARTRVGYVPQSIPFDARFPVCVREVVSMGRVAKSRFGFYGRADRTAVSDALAKVGLDGFDTRPFSELSGGERQRVMIAQALAGGSEILFLDEPVANVDPQCATALYELFSSLTRHVTILMVSHNLGVVTSHASHILCVNRTAELHTIDEVESGTITASGGILATLRHGTACPVLDASSALHSPHHARSQNNHEE